MAKIIEWNDLEKHQWKKWLNSCPPIIKNLAEKFPIDRLYLYKPTSHRATIASYYLDGTLSLNITGQYNRILFSRKVFSVNPENIEECDLPSEGEDLGDTAKEAGYSEKDIIEILIPKIKNGEL